MNGLTKLTRTYAAQMAALKHCRTGGEQRVIVQRVDVRNGAQPVVGVVNSGKGGEAPEQKRGQSYALTDARSDAVLCDVEAEREAVPSSGGAGPADMLDARGYESRGADREAKRELSERDLDEGMAGIAPQGHCAAPSAQLIIP